MDLENLTLKNSEIEKKYNTDFTNGLNDKQVNDHCQKFGKNELPKEKNKPWGLIFLESFFEPIQVILLIAGIISIVAPMAANNWAFKNEYMIDFYVIIGIVLIDAFIETIQAVKARKSMDALKNLSIPNAVVIRNGMQQEIPATELVVGDIVVLEAGRFVPSDLRIIEQIDLMIDESILTGESELVHKTAEPVEETEVLADMKNIAFMSTFTNAGRAVGIVIRVGVETEIGKIAVSVSSNKDKPTPLEKRLTSFSYWIAGLSAIIGLIIFGSLLFVGSKQNWSEYLMVAITIAIGVIPESLSAVVSITLSLSTKRMAAENVIVKKLSAVETLGSVNVICTDKTGTLTQNKMTVKKIILNEKIVTDEEYKNISSKFHQDLFMKSLILCNDSVTEGDERIGDPTELALVDFAELYGWDEQDARKKYLRLKEKPFDSERKMMSTVNKVDDKEIIFSKGAIDQLLKKCNRILENDKVRKITQEDIKKLLEESAKLSSDALRVLAFAYGDDYEKVKDKDLETDLVFIGAIAMIDPVRKSAIEAVRLAHEAGIEVVMITGDHAITALAIGRDLDLAYSDYEVMTSDKLETMTDHDLKKIIEQIHIFARVNPEHKVRIVELLQANGNITSMTGDGVNDAPSLSRADIGVAMGITGTDVAKQAADVILTDDNFETIIKAVYEGRNVFQKIRRAVAFVLGFNLANVFGIFVLSLVNHVSPLEATDILWMNLVIESVIAVCMGMSENDPSVMKQKPEKGFKSLFKGIMYTVTLITLIVGATEVGAFYLGMYFMPNDVKDSFAAYGGWREYLNNPLTTTDQKINALKYGRTALFIVITIAPSIYSNFLRLTNWKSSKKIIVIKNRPLMFSTFGVSALNILLLFIPFINSNILQLMSISDYQDGNAILIIPVSLGLSLIPTAMILTISLVRHVIYHYRPETWRRNQLIVSQMVEQDKIEMKKIAKNKKNRV